MKNTITDKKNKQQQQKTPKESMIDWMVEEQISELEGRIMEITEAGEKKESEDSLRDI